MSVASVRTRSIMWSRSHGTAVNCTRWVSSCMQTQSRKSAGSTPELALDLHEVGRDEHQLGRAAGGEVVLPEDLAGHEGEQGARPRRR